MPASPLCWPKYRETVSWGMSTCISPAIRMAGTIRGRMKTSIETPWRAPTAGRPGSFRYAMTPSTTATSTNTSVERWARIARLWHIARGRAGARRAILDEHVDHFGPSVIDSLDDAVVVTDTRLAVIAWNPAMERLTGITPAGALGRPAERLLEFLRETRQEGLLKRALDGESATAELRCAVPGRPGHVWLQARYFPWHGRTGELAGVVGVHTDVSERRRRATFVRAVEAVGQSLASSLDLNRVLDTIVGKALEVMAAESAMVVSWDGQAATLTVMRAAGRLSREYAAAGPIPVGGGPISRAIMQGAPVACTNVLTDPETWLHPERRAQIEREGFKAVAAAPLASKSGAHGALVVHYWSERSFDEEELGALRWLAEQAGLAIDNARVYADATRRAENLRELAEVEQLVTQSLVVDDVLRGIAQAAARLLDAPVVQLWTASPGQRTLHLQASYLAPGTAEVSLPTAIAFGEGVAGRVADTKHADLRERRQSGQPHAVRGLGAPDRYLADALGADPGRRRGAGRAECALVHRRAGHRRAPRAGHLAGRPGGGRAPERTRVRRRRAARRPPARSGRGEPLDHRLARCR